MTTISRELAEAHAAGDPTLESMLRKNMTLDRDTYIAHQWGGDVPEEWTWEHEAELPEFFQDDNAVKPVPGRKGAKDVHQD